jgi:hypothetical protein
MSYNSTIPQGTDQRLISQYQIRANYQAIAKAFAANHSALTDGDEFQGMHRVLTMRPQALDPTTSATQTALYNKLVAGIPAMFFRPNSNQTPIQLTYKSISTSTPTSEYSFVAGPFVIYGGKISPATNGQVVVLSPTTTLLYVGLTTANLTASSTISGYSIPTSITGSQFTITNKSGGATVKFDVYYIAIGQ